ncbi:M48 family metallopeptidase [Burkholderia sp. AU31624]|uniref:M48 family metallopeptidase n=1 Tax=Burkholderia sp. AU31624 TaxID=2879629 RepID=UPI001CF3CA21|nr:SprT family zinc-dependent metalloprotease [Burkholderia sp. AU31624]MCA8254105.1 M48 family metallopeptidase [Burkholderia sp. AU31624]
MKQRPRPRPAVVALDHRQMDLPLFDGPAAAPSAPATPPAPPEAAPAAPLDPGLAPDRSRVRTFALDSRVLEYRLKRSARRTIGFTIDGSGLSITAPRWVTLADIEAAISEKQRWIFAKLAEWKTRTEQRALPQIDWRDGATLPYLGKTVTIALGAGAVAFDTDALRLSLPLPVQADMQQIKDRVQGWLQGEAKRIFGARLAVYAEKLGVTYSMYALSSAATRWGSCSSDGKIRLNWRLIHFPMSIIDYVVAHELSHLREMNHSPAFWQTVESIFPEFREARHTLKHHPPELLPSL